VHHFARQLASPFPLLAAIATAASFKKKTAVGMALAVDDFLMFSCASAPWIHRIE
jgi:hypothetical protein